MARRKSAGDLTSQQSRVLCDLSDRIDQLFIDHDASQPLGGCILTFSRPGGNTRALGFYKPLSWEDAQGNIRAEIAINPEGMALLGFTEVVQTLVHEKVHQWQHEHGKPSRRRYHNKEWGWKMEALGLMPSDTGKPGGKKTGERMADYVIEGGPLDRFIRKMPKRLRLPFMGLPSERKQKTVAGYVRYDCPSCELVARAKRDVNIWCGECDVQMAGEL